MFPQSNLDVVFHATLLYLLVSGETYLDQMKVVGKEAAQRDEHDCAKDDQEHKYSESAQ